MKGKVAVVTGGAQGIGRAIALRFAQAGADVAIFDVNSRHFERVTAEVKSLGVRAISALVDVSDSRQVSEAIDRVGHEFGRLDVLVNNAGVMDRALVEQSSDEHWDRMLGVNLLGPVYCSRAAIPWLKKNGGSIINCSSILGTFPNTASAAYGTAKLGVTLLTKVMGAELAPHGIRVNAYAPGVANTEFAADVIKQRGAEKVKQIALNRFGEPEDIASVVFFLASPEAAYVTGQTIAVDGGMWITQTPTRTWSNLG